MSTALSVLPAADTPADYENRLADPGRDIRNGAIIAFAFFVLFLGWAAFARLDAAAYAPGVLEVSGQRQTVQHRDGGVVGVRRDEQPAPAAVPRRVRRNDPRAWRSPRPSNRSRASMCSP